MTDQPFTDEQKQYLAGFAAGAGIAHGAMKNIALPQLGAPTSGGGGGPEAIHLESQDRTIAAGGKLTPEEKAKRDKNPLDMWDELQSRADAGEFPKATDVFLTKFQGLFYVAPAQNSYMCRLRLPGGVITAHQFRGVADIAEKYGGGYTHVTTRANLQIREIDARNPLNVVTALQELGIVTRGAGADNIRNVTATPTAGIDPLELIDTLPPARQLHHYILNHREMYGLPRKFNIAFDGGGTISSLADTNDIGFQAVRLSEAHATADFPAGVYFRMELGGITGHKDFARDAGLMLRPGQCIPLAAAVVCVFIKHGDRTDRKKARLKYLLDAWGLDRFMRHAQDELKFPLPKLDRALCEPRQSSLPGAHIDFHPQKQPGLQYAGVVLPVGKITIAQMRGLADIAERHGSGTIRLTCWQNLLLSDIPDVRVELVKHDLEKIGLTHSAANIRAGLVACTGNTGCKFSATNTKLHALQIADYVESRLDLDQPINIHLTGCHHSCAQHYIGDIGLLGTTVERGEDMIEAYHVYLGGGYGEHQGIGREIYRSIPANELPPLVERLLRGYLANRQNDESFCAFARRHDIEALKSIFEQTVESHV